MIPKVIILLALACPVLMLLCLAGLVIAAVVRGSGRRPDDGTRRRAMEKAWKQLDRIEDQIDELETALISRNERNGS